jgi:hypothetical protein
MGRTKRGTVTRLSLAGGSDEAPVSLSHPKADPLPEGTLRAARIVSVDEATRQARVEIGADCVDAALDAAVDLAVVLTAHTRGERLMVERRGEGWVVLGSLRTTATPGVDKGDEYLIAAKRIRLEGDHDVRLVSGASSFVLRAVGQLELLAQNITSRASSVHKIVGRMLHLN